MSIKNDNLNTSRNNNIIFSSQSRGARRALTIAKVWRTIKYTTKTPQQPTHKSSTRSSPVPTYRRFVMSYRNSWPCHFITVKTWTMSDIWYKMDMFYKMTSLHVCSTKHCLTPKRLKSKNLQNANLQSFRLVTSSVADFKYTFFWRKFSIELIFRN